jgi:hypothetical protein
MRNLHYKKIYFGFAIVMFVVLATPFVGFKTYASTSTNYTLLAPLPCLSGMTSVPCGTSNNSPAVTQIDINSYISYAYKLALALAVVLAVIMITIGGFEYMLSGAISSKNDAKERIWNAVLGLLLALCSYIILYTIDPYLIISNLNQFSNLSGQENNLTGATTTQLLQNSNTNSTPPITQQGLVQQAATGAQNATLNSAGTQNAPTAGGSGPFTASMPITTPAPTPSGSPIQLLSAPSSGTQYQLPPNLNSSQ